jgi:4-carboxymuconolactone decarboxylase
MSEAEDEADWLHGFDMMDAVYGPGYSETRKNDGRAPLLKEIVTNLFGKVWAKPGLSIREKRLMVIGATTVLGRGDLLAVQVEGALANGELTEDQLEEMCVLMLFYAGVGNAAALYTSMKLARTRVKEKQAVKSGV